MPDRQAARADAARHLSRGRSANRDEPPVTSAPSCRRNGSERRALRAHRSSVTERILKKLCRDLTPRSCRGRVRVPRENGEDAPSAAAGNGKPGRRFSAGERQDDAWEVGSRKGRKNSYEPFSLGRRREANVSRSARIRHLSKKFAVRVIAFAFGYVKRSRLRCPDGSE